MHDVAISSKTNKDFLVYESSTDLWKNKSLGTVLAGTSSQFVKGNGTLDSNTYIDNVNAQTVGGVKTFSNMPILGSGSGVNGQIVYADASNQLKTITNFKYNDSTGVITTLLGNLGSNAYTSTAYQPLLTNPITGTGTTNYLPKFTGSTALGNSLIYDNGTNVGIGKTTMSSLLDVNGQIRSEYTNAGGNVSIISKNLSSIINGTSQFIATNDVGRGLRIQYSASGGFGSAALTGGITGEGAQIFTDGNYPLLLGTNVSANMYLGTNGNVGIGTTSPSAKLNVSGDIHIGDYGTSATRVFETRTSTNLFSITTYPTNADGTLITYSWANGGQGPLRFGNASSVVLALTASGNVLVPTLGTGLVYSNNGTLTSTNPSDERLKDNIVSLNYGLNEILKLRPVSYNWKNDNINQGKQFGFIAQEVQEVMPELVKEFKTEYGERLGLDKEGIYAALVNAIQEQQKQIEELKKLIK